MNHRLIYELPSALADGFKKRIEAALAKIMEKSIILTALAKAKKENYFMFNSAKAFFVQSLFSSAKADGNS